MSPKIDDAEKSNEQERGGKFLSPKQRKVLRVDIFAILLLACLVLTLAYQILSR